MLQFSYQHRIVSDLSLSFQKNIKVHTKISEKIQTRDRVFLKPKKYETYTEMNFKFIVLLTVFKHKCSKINTLKIINSYDKEDIKEIMKHKEKIVLYKNTLDKDETFMLSKIKSKENILNFYNKDEISLLYIFKYFSKNTQELSRIEKKTIQNINLFISFFPKIEQELKEI